jgi:hypothetical protein
MKTRIEQDQAIAQITDYLRMIRDHFDVPMGVGTTIRSFMLDHGVACYMGEQSFAGPRQEPGMCYMNAYRAAAADRSLTYVEGWCHMGLIPIEHAWCIDRDGQVIDPTLREASGYFGIPFRWRYVQRTALRTGVYGVIGLTNRKLLDLPVDTFLARMEQPA